MAPADGRLVVDGKFFAQDNTRFSFRGVTYGTFAPRADGAAFPERARLRNDFELIADAGFTVVRTYTLPPDDVIDAAAEHGLLLFAESFYPDWRYITGGSQRDVRDVLVSARRTVRAAARQFAGNPHIAALSLGNEIPADVIRWVGTRTIARAIGDLASTVRDEDPDLLVTYGNYPTTEFLPLPDLDFLTFNVFLERHGDLRRYIARLHNLTGERPVVIGEFGLDAGVGDDVQAASVDRQLRTAVEGGAGGTCLFSWTDDWWVGGTQVRGWHFGLTSEDRTPRPALDVARTWNRRDVRDVSSRWPSVSVVVCAYNAAATLDECLRHTCALDYPDLEIIVVDDGSTDDTAAIASRYERVVLVPIVHAGLSAARNAGYAAARGEIVAYLDSDAYPSPEWPYYLALGLEGSRVAAVGGPNLSPPADAVPAQMVNAAPGGPVHVLLGDDRAEHIPGCNMAFRKDALVATGGFDPAYTAAGDDVDLCWKLLDAGHEIGFQPAAVVWHHRRGGLRAYLRQQAGYGRAEALVQARHPHRFTHLGSARWRGRIYGSPVAPLARESIYRGRYGTAAYQSVYRGGGHAFDLAHQIGVPAAAFVIGSAPLAAVWRPYLLAVMVALAGLAALFVVDAVRVRPPERLSRGRISFRAHVAAMWLLQPLWRHMARRRASVWARRELGPPAALGGPVQHMPGGVLLVPDSGPRDNAAETLVAGLHRHGMEVASPIGWEDHDARVAGSFLVSGDVVTSAYPAGCLQIRVRRHLRARRVALLFTAIAILLLAGELRAAVVVSAFASVSLTRGFWRCGPGVRRVIERMFSAREKRPADVRADSAPAPAPTQTAART